MGSARPHCCKILSLCYLKSNSTKKKKKKTQYSANKFMLNYIVLLVFTNYYDASYTPKYHFD